MRKRTIAITATCAIWMAPGIASAHAVLVASDPGAGTRVDRAPEIVTLTFDEPVEISVGSLRVFDATGASHAFGTVFHPGGDPRSISTHVRNLHRGSFVVSWQVVSADTHIVDGAFAFGFGEPAGETPRIARDPASERLLSVLRFFMLTGAVVGIGLALFGVTPAIRVPSNCRPIEIVAWITLAFFALTDVLLRADITQGSPAAVFATRVGVLRAVTIASALAALLAIAGKRRQIVLLASAMAVAIALSLAGHAAVGNWVAVGFSADLVHLIAAAAWVGLLIVAISMDAAGDIRIISRAAPIAVVAIVVTGIVQTVRNITALSLLFTSRYGLTLDLKVGLLALALFAALGARRSLGLARRSGRNFIRFELLALTGVIAVTAILVETPLPREASAMPSRTTSFPLLDATVHVSATRTGPLHWVVHVDATDASGHRRALDGVGVTLRDAQRDTGPLVIPLTRDASGAFAADAALPWRGSWTALVSARVGEFDENHRTLSLTENQP